MAQCVRRLVLAATLAAAVALLLCTSSAPVARAAETGDFTEEQRTNTLAVLQAFGRAIPELGEKWTGADFCVWELIVCDVTGVSLSGIGTTYAGTLPEMPENVDYRHVVIKQLDFSKMGLGLSGALPDSWSRLQGLTSLTLSGCGVSGTLPGTWSSLTSLTALHLQGTPVSGSLPPEWSSMLNAELLELENCDLSGSLPSSWSSMPKLRSVSLSGNKFCGCVPDSWAQKADLVVDIEDEHKGSDCTTDRVCPTAPETECEVDGCEVCEGDSAARCARCREGYFLTDEKTCLVHNDGGVAAASSGVAAAAVVCVAVLLSVGLAA